MDLFAAVDVHFPDIGGARAALVVATDCRFSTVAGEYVALIPAVAPYQAGAFYVRELPAIHDALALAGPIGLLVIDGYVDLDPAGRPGLGVRLHPETSLPVVGVAKTAFHTATHAVPVLRGKSLRPLFVTSAGVGVREAATMVAGMAGPYRLPDALRRVDALARGRGPSP